MKSSLFFTFLVLTGFLSGYCGEIQSAAAEEDAAKKAYFDSFKNRKEKAVPDLLITANYQSCAILAAIARKEKGTACILLPAAGDKKGRIWFIPAKTKDIIPLAEKDLGKFISLLDPARIIVLGDELIVPGKFRPLSTENRPAINIVSGNWKFNALILGNLLCIWDMQKTYLEAMKKDITEPFKSLDAPVEVEKKAKNVNKDKTVKEKAVKKVDQKKKKAEKAVKVEKKVEKKAEKTVKAVKEEKKVEKAVKEDKTAKKQLPAKNVKEEKKDLKVKDGNNKNDNKK